MKNVSDFLNAQFGLQIFKFAGKSPKMTWTYTDSFFWWTLQKDCGAFRAIDVYIEDSRSNKSTTVLSFWHTHNYVCIFPKLYIGYKTKMYAPVELYQNLTVSYSKVYKYIALKTPFNVFGNQKLWVLSCSGCRLWEYDEQNSVFEILMWSS